MRPFALVLVGLAVVAAACGGDEPSQARPTSTASVAIVMPEANATITGATMTVEVDLRGGVIVPETSRDLTPDEGHIHISIDGEVLTLNSGLTDELDTPEPGRHLLQVEFVAKDHAPFDPRVVASVPFEVAN